MLDIEVFIRNAFSMKIFKLSYRTVKGFQELKIIRNNKSFEEEISKVILKQGGNI